MGGIPELLNDTELVPAGDQLALASKIQEVLKNPKRMEAMSIRNLEVSREYSDAALSARRRGFYQYVRDFTQRWEASQAVRQ